MKKNSKTLDKKLFQAYLLKWTAIPETILTANMPYPINEKYSVNKMFYCDKVIFEK